MHLRPQHADIACALYPSAAMLHARRQSCCNLVSGVHRAPSLQKFTYGMYSLPIKSVSKNGGASCNGNASAQTRCGGARASPSATAAVREPATPTTRCHSTRHSHWASASHSSIGVRSQDTWRVRVVTALCVLYSAFEVCIGP